MIHDVKHSDGKTIWRWEFPDGEEFEVMRERRSGTYKAINPHAKCIAKFLYCNYCQEFYDDYDPKQTMNYQTLCRRCWLEKRHLNTVAPRAVKIDIPDKYITARPDDFPRGIREAVAGWPGKMKFVVYVGPEGRGKTHGAWAAVRCNAQAGKRVEMRRAEDIRTMWLSSFAESRRTDFAKSVANVPLLVLDDLSIPSASQGWARALHSIIDDRLNNNRPTLITSMTKPEEYAAYGAQFVSRLKEFIWIPFDGDDRRGVKPVQSVATARPAAAKSHAAAQADYKAKLVALTTPHLPGEKK